MKYHYEKPEISVPVYGELYSFHNKHPVYKAGTLFSFGKKGLVIVQQHFIEKDKFCYWGSVDPDIANDIYTSPYFNKWFRTYATEDNYPIFRLRSAMWQLRMKPLKREEWENCFGTT